MQNQQISYLEQTLGISRGELAAIVGCSYSSLQRLSSGIRTTHVVGKEPEIIELLLRMTRAASQLYGKNSAMVKTWLRLTPPGVLPPIKQIASVEKLVCITLELETLISARAGETAQGSPHVDV